LNTPHASGALFFDGMEAAKSSAERSVNAGSAQERFSVLFSSKVEPVPECFFQDHLR